MSLLQSSNPQLRFSLANWRRCSACFLWIFQITCRLNGLAPTFSLRNLCTVFLKPFWPLFDNLFASFLVLQPLLWTDLEITIFAAAARTEGLPSPLRISSCFLYSTSSTIVSLYAGWPQHLKLTGPGSSQPQAYPMRMPVFTMMLLGNVVFSNKSRSVLDGLYKCTYFMYRNIKSTHSLVFNFSHK